MPASYPSAIKTFTTLVDGVDDVLAAHQNDPNAEITAIETELGTNPRGTATDVKTRLDAAHTTGGLHTLKINTGDLVDLSVTDVKLAASAISQAKLKTSQGSVTSASSVWNFQTLPGGEYGFCPQLRDTNGGPSEVRWASGAAALPSTYTTIIDLNGHSGQLSAQQRYVTASGRHHWVFLVIAKQDHDETDTQGIVHHFVKGQIKGVWEAPDHPCVGQGGDENDIPHPFVNYWKSVPPHLEIVLLDESQLDELKAQVTRGQDLAQVILQNYHVDVDDPQMPYTPREIIEIDEDGSKRGEIIEEFPTPEFAKLVITSEKITLKRRMVEVLPAGVKHMKLKKKP